MAQTAANDFGGKDTGALLARMRRLAFNVPLNNKNRVETNMD